MSCCLNIVPEGSFIIRLNLGRIRNVNRSEILLTLRVVRAATIETADTESLNNVFEVLGDLDSQLSGWS